MRWEFRLLGPVEVRRDGVLVGLGPAKRVAMVAGLLVDANRPVPLGRLTEALWPGLVPRSARANLRTHASVLRRMLGARLVTLPEAYQLRVGDDEVDVARFVQLAGEGRRALTAGEVPAAVAGLGAALGLWRGTAGGGVSRGAWLGDLLAGLDQQRLDVLEDHVEARLHTGAYGEVVADLRRHLSGEPLRERGWGQLMVALYRLGRAAEALDAYAHARGVLRERLGVEPGRELQQLQRAILNRDGALDGDRVSPVRLELASVVVPRPRQPPEQLQAAPIPSEPGSLFGRSGELELVAGMVSDAAPAGGGVVVCGRAGVGKSALARRVAHLVADDFPDGQVYLDLAPAGALAAALDLPGDEAMAALLRGLGVASEIMPRSAVEKAGLIRSLTAGRRLMVILDNASSSAQVRPLLTAAVGLRVLVTSRRRLGAAWDAATVTLPVLPVDDAVDLLTSYVGRVRIEEDRPGAVAVARMCDGLPMALRIAGGRLSTHPDLSLSTLAEMMALNPLDGLELGDLSMRAHLAHDYQVVAGEEAVTRRVFPLLGRLAPQETVSVQQVAGRLGEDPSRVFRALERLVDAHLAETSRAGHYRAPGLLRHFAAELQLVAG